MDSLMLPPEITSALIHTGPGASSLVDASVAWQRLAAELENSLAGHAAVLSSVMESWNGPSATAMVQAVQPYLAWMRTTAQQCQQTASSAQTAAAAFNTARAAVVPPAAVTANRTRLAQLLATNRFGSNLPAIAETENQYQVMWANNSAAMVRYHTTSAQASTLTQPSSPPQIASPTAAATQASALPATTASPAAQSAVTSAASSLASFDPNAGWFGLANTWGNQFISSGFPINLLSYLAQNTSAQALQGVGGEIGQGLAEGEAALGASEASLANAVTAIGSGSAPTAALGVGVTVGKLSMPPAVVGLLPATQTPVQLASVASPLAAADSGLPALPVMPMMVPPPTSAGSGWRKRKQQKFEDLDYGAQLPKTVIHRPPSGG